MNVLVQEVMFYINTIEQDYVYPLLNALFFESNIMQWEVLGTTNRHNPVAETEEWIQRLDDDLAVLVILYQFSIENIASEFRRLNDHFNEVKQNFFPVLKSTGDYFIFTANRIRDTMPDCVVANETVIIPTVPNVPTKL